MKILMLHRQQTAVGYYRTWVPARALRAAGHDVVFWEDRSIRKMAGRDLEGWLKRVMAKHASQGGFDVIVVDRAVMWGEALLYAGFRHYQKNCRMICDFDDDVTEVPLWNKSSDHYYRGQEAREAGLGHMKLAEMCTVSTPELVGRFRARTHAIRLAENRLDPADWGGPVDPEKSKENCVRVLYGGAGGHFADMDEARPAVEFLLRNQPVPWRLHVFGAAPAWVHELHREYADEARVIWHDWAPFKDYPDAIAWGGFDIAIAPLADHPFNHTKSNIKYLEAGIQRIAFLGSDVGPYSSIPSDCGVTVANTETQWREALSALLTDAALRQRLTERAYAHVRDTYTVEQSQQVWQAIVEEAAQLPRLLTAEDIARLPAEAGPPAEATPQ